ncbi:MAG TPA: hypothetical protein VFV93_15605, partial [Thermomicrobiales bacterium]|nr:hypothetical protein [Thermomicrobiales bacterium]
EGSDVSPSPTAAPAIADEGGNWEALPALTPAASLAIPISGPCNLDALVLRAASDVPTSATIHLLDATGRLLWQETASLDGHIIQLQPPLDRATCDEHFVGAITIAADADVIAELIDSASGLRILPAQPAATNWLLGPLPRDRFATLEATARLTLSNPTSNPVDASIRLLTESDTLLRATSVSLQPGATVALDVDLQNGVAVSVTASAPIVAGAVGWLPGGSYAIPLMRETAEWQFGVQPASDRDAGVWLALANDSSDPRHVTLRDADTRRELTICAGCAAMLHLSSDDAWRTASLTSDGGPIAVAAVAYQERTGSLHFDLGLPLLAALPVRIAGPDGAPIVSSIAVLVLAVGLFELLRRIGVAEPLAARSAGAVALLAPLAPYAVRLYTEPLAACLIVWSLVCWDTARRRPLFAIASLTLAGALPLVHGRYTPLAAVLAALAVSAGLSHARASRRQVLALAAVAVVVIAAVAVSPLAVALRDRAGLGYFSTEWVSRNLPGILLDRGSGLLPFAPWILLSFAAPRSLKPLQWVAILLFLVQLSVVMLRAGGWQTFGAPARYMLPVVPLLALLAAPGAARLWRSLAGRLTISALLIWSAAVTFLLLWVPLSGYISAGRYFIDDAVDGLLPLEPLSAFPAIAPAAGSNLVGLLLLLLVWGCATSAVLRARR